MTYWDIVGCAAFALAGGLAGARWGFVGAVIALALTIVLCLLSRLDGGHR